MTPDVARSARVAPGYLTIPARDKGVVEIGKLVDRLHAALKLSDDDVAAWKRTLPPLLDKADQGTRPVEAGLLYDNHYCMVWRVENGRIKEIKEYCDSALVERVLGPFPEARKLAS